MTDITDWDHGDGLTGFANYLEAQIELPATLHREYWRKHMDYAIRNEHIRESTQVPMHPCNQYSRWRDYSFTAFDFGKEFKVEAITIGGEEMYKISVQDSDSGDANGFFYYEPRTVIAPSEFHPINTVCPNLGLENFCGEGEYVFCKSC